jgi:Cysteine rich repeat
MNRGDEMAANIATGQGHSAGGAAGSDDRVSEQLRATFKDLLRPSSQPKPGGDLHEVMTGIGRHLQNESLAIKTISDRLLAIEHQAKKRVSGGFARYLLTICIGVVATLAWQSYGEAAKQMFAAKVPELGWSPETKQMIANWVEQLGWTKPPATPERTAVRSSATETSQAASVAQTTPENVTPKAPAAPSVDPEQVHQIAMDLTALRQTVDQLAINQDKIGRNIDRLQAADQEILVKIPESPPPPPIAAAPAVAGRPAPGGAPPSENTQNTATTSASPPVGHPEIDSALRASCGPDVRKLCSGISTENDGVIKCLTSHRMELSPTCDAYFNNPMHRAAQKDAPKVTSPNR